MNKNRIKNEKHPSSTVSKPNTNTGIKNQSSTRPPAMEKAKSVNSGQNKFSQSMKSKKDQKLTNDNLQVNNHSLNSLYSRRNHQYQNSMKSLNQI